MSKHVDGSVPGASKAVTTGADFQHQSNVEQHRNNPAHAIAQLPCTMHEVGLQTKPSTAGEVQASPGHLILPEAEAEVECDVTVAAPTQQFSGLLVSSAADPQRLCHAGCDKSVPHTIPAHAVRFMSDTTAHGSRPHAPGCDQGTVPQQPVLLPAGGHITSGR